MNKKIVFWAYGCLLAVLIFLLPIYLMPEVTNYQKIIIFTGYLDRPFFVTVATTMVCAFECLSLVIPVEEVINVQTLVLTRRPSLWQQWRGYGRYALPYLGAFIAMKVYGYYFCFSSRLIWWGLTASVVWMAIFTVTVSTRVKYRSVPVIVSFIGIRVLMMFAN